MTVDAQELDARAQAACAEAWETAVRDYAKRRGIRLSKVGKDLQQLPEMRHQRESWRIGFVAGYTWAARQLEDGDAERLMLLEQRAARATEALQLAEHDDDQVRYARDLLLGREDEELFGE